MTIIWLVILAGMILFGIGIAFSFGMLVGSLRTKSTVLRQVGPKLEQQFSDGKREGDLMGQRTIYRIVARRIALLVEAAERIGKPIPLDSLRLMERDFNERGQG